MTTLEEAAEIADAPTEEESPVAPQPLAPSKNPLQFENNELAKSINDKLNKLLGDDYSLCHVGESVALVSEDKLATTNIPSHYFLIASLLALGVLFAIRLRTTREPSPIAAPQPAAPGEAFKGMQ